mgnify:CR=1 FL=1
MAYGSRKPVAPVGKIILLIGFLLGIMIPTVIVYIKELLNTKIHNKKERPKKTETITSSLS